MNGSYIYTQWNKTAYHNRHGDIVIKGTESTETEEDDRIEFWSRNKFKPDL
jgi:hypothetical protein